LKQPLRLRVREDNSALRIHFENCIGCGFEQQQETLSRNRALTRCPFTFHELRARTLGFTKLGQIR
jgi:hypothetical protein